MEVDAPQLSAVAVAELPPEVEASPGAELIAVAEAADEDLTAHAAGPPSSSSVMASIVEDDTHDPDAPPADDDASMLSGGVAAVAGARGRGRGRGGGPGSRGGRTKGAHKMMTA